MLISKQWLQDFIDLSKVDPKEIAKRLSLSTVEVEGVKTLGEGLEGVVVGLVKTVEKHPNADKLNVCSVSVGSKTLNIVCGGSNVRVGMKVALAGIGAKVKWHGEGELVELKPVEIRGVASEGMICGADEIGLIEMFPKKEEKEIVDLSAVASAKAGTPLAKALGLDDVIFEIDNKSLSNRPDLWGHYGIAREISALFQKNLKPYKTKNIPKGKGVSLTVQIDPSANAQGINKKLCPRYMAVSIDGIMVAPSPEWMQARLRAAGVRPINNVVDITNYVMMEVGQPMHAFDAGQIKDSRFKIKGGGSDLQLKSYNLNLVVRKAHEGEKMKALDGKEYSLSKEMLVVADTENVLAIAGVMGGVESSVTESTTTIIFESANFEPSSIRKTSTALALRTESSARFEKGQPREQVEAALKKAVELTLDLIPGAHVASAVVDKKVPVKKLSPLIISFEQIEKKLGVGIKSSDIVSILQRLGFAVTKTKVGVRITVPEWRTKDVNIVEDVIEEIVRVYGYGKIPATLPVFPIVPPQPNELQALERKIKELLAYEQGFTEVYNYSFVSTELLTRIGVDPAKHLALDNPIAKDRPLLRRGVKAGLMENIESNLHRYSSVKLFEIGRAYMAEVLENDLPQQPTMLGLVYAEQGNDTPFFTVSAALRSVLSRLGVEVTFAKSDTVGPIYHPGRSAYVVVRGQKIGSIGEVHPAVAKRLGIDSRVAVSEIALTALVPLLKEKIVYHAIPAFPAVTRDIAFVVDAHAEHEAIAIALRSIDPLIKQVELFDVFSGGNILAGKKSMAYHVVYEHPDKTLEAGAVDAIHTRVRDTLVKTFAAEIR